MPFGGKDATGAPFSWQGEGDGGATPFVLAVTEQPRAPIGEGGVTVTAASSVVKTATAGRRAIEVSNGHATIGIWVHFGASAATSGQGSYLPPKASNRWPYAGEVRAIAETTGNVPVGYVEW